MALVSYSDSEEDEQPVAKRSKKDAVNHEDDDLPPLPASFLNLYSSSVRVSNTDDPSLHHGRKRIVKHVEGNWPTHVYLEWLPSPNEHETLTRLLKTLPNSTVHSLIETPLQVPLPLHVSLSAPLVLRTESKDTFLDDITEQLKSVVRSLRQPIKVRPASLSWHGNEDSSRYFLVLRVQDPQQSQSPSSLTLLNQLLLTSNRIAARHNQPQLYTKLAQKNSSNPTKATATAENNNDFSPYFHISIGWTLPSTNRNLEDDNLAMQPIVKEILDDLCENMIVSFDAVKVRIGQTVTALPIGGSQTSKKRGLFD
ncbi:hypothetical protein D6C92_08084 [Aureobasidium pullulans]|nr:hypothetical protein D6C92_08084 [Aureobasidium pullulans]